MVRVQRLQIYSYMLLIIMMVINERSSHCVLRRSSPTQTCDITAFSFLALGDKTFARNGACVRYAYSWCNPGDKTFARNGA
mmetsp:Transcript_23092/g.35141  ORF Transcript_23092/g.35141 Transcript_23092/m.35141 type:complete len:81 (-) Transcript_23092:761-1003(-)